MLLRVAVGACPEWQMGVMVCVIAWKEKDCLLSLSHPANPVSASPAVSGRTTPSSTSVAWHTLLFPTVAGSHSREGLADSQNLTPLHSPAIHSGSHSVLTNTEYSNSSRLTFVKSRSSFPQTAKIVTPDTSRPGPLYQEVQCSASGISPVAPVNSGTGYNAIDATMATKENLVSPDPASGISKAMFDTRYILHNLYFKLYTSPFRTGGYYIKIASQFIVKELLCLTTRLIEKWL